MESDVEFPHRGHRQSHPLGYEHYEHLTQSQVQEANPAESPAPWVSDRSVMDPLIAEYDRHNDEMAAQLRDNEISMTDLKTKLDRVIMENERLHAELRESVEKQLHAQVGISGLDADSMDEGAVIKNLQEQLQCSEKERTDAMELWQTAVEQLDTIQQVYEKTVSDGQTHDAQTQLLKDQLAHFQQRSHKFQLWGQSLESTNQQFLKTMTQQGKEMEALQSQHRQSKAELRTASAKVDEVTKLLQSAQDQLQKREEDMTVAVRREDAAERRLHQLQSALTQMDERLKDAAQETETFRRELAVWEKKVCELQARCTSLEEEKYEALAKVRESVQVAEEATLQKDQTLLREKQKTEELEKTKEAIKHLIQSAVSRTKKEVDNVRKQCNIQINRMTEELSAMQLECTDKDTQIEKSLRERKALEEELEKVYKEGRAEPEFRKLDVLHQKYLDAERVKEEMSLALQSNQNKLKKMEIDYNEELSRCQEEVRRLQGFLAMARDDCAGVSEERLRLQQENMQLCKEMEELRKATLQVQRKAKEQLSQMEQEYSLKEQGLDARVRELEENSHSSSVELTRLLSAQQKSTNRWKEETKNLVQTFETKIVHLRSELNQQKQHSFELQMQVETNNNTITEYERQLAENQEKTSHLQRRLSQAEQKATAATQQLNNLVAQRRKAVAIDAETG
ncbi:sodium channel and clathrin linker 1 [Neosynchiropus ocellatus]